MVLDTSNHSNDETAIVESLKPHLHLRRLEIYSFNGTACPDWVAHLSHEQVAMHLAGGVQQVGLNPASQEPHRTEVGGLCKITGLLLH